MIKTTPTYQTQSVQPASSVPINTEIPPNIEIGTVQGLLGVAAILLGIGVAWGTLRTLVKGIKDDLDADIKPNIQNMRERFVIVEDRVRTLWKDEVAPAGSPRQLNTRGENILAGSGIKEMIDQKKGDLLALVKEKTIGNPYDAEQSILQVVSDLKKDPDIVEKLKTGAFSVGVDIDTVLLVGGIHLRNLIFPDLGFSITDLDEHKKPL